jgi:ATP-dependent Lon protease
MLPIMATRNLVLFPGVTIPVSLVRSESVMLAKQASEERFPIGIVCQIDPEVESPSLKDLHRYGVFADVMKVFELPDGSQTAVVMARGKFQIKGSSDVASLHGTTLVAKVSPVRDVMPRSTDTEFPVMLEQIRTLSEAIIRKTPEIPDELAAMLRSIDDAQQLINSTASHLPFPSDDKQQLLAMYRMKDRAFGLIGQLTESQERADLTREIMNRARHTMEEHQRNAFLQQQMDTIRQELYGGDDDFAQLLSRSEEIDLPESVRTAFNKELDKLNRFNPQSPDYSVSLNYLETILDLPWNVESELNVDFNKAREILNEDHYGLENVKNRILEQIAVLLNNPTGKAPILCFVGAPGVGKTSLGQSIAKALGRVYQRVSLGGLHDEAEIRGHRRTYIGAMPGRIIDAMRRAKYSNPLLLLDEIDKVGRDFKGDPYAALLEVLDPEQNCHFHDNYIDVDYDLSKVLFIATANTLSTLPQPLLDRMEVIDISGYILEEKVEIARHHLIPRILKELNMTEEDVSISDDALVKVIEEYTSESGVRHLEKCISTIVRKAVLKKVSGEEYNHNVAADQLKDYLGVAHYQHGLYDGNDFAGVVTGLAWTSVGGEITMIESSLSLEKGDKLALTGNLGDVMKESAMIAYQYVKAHAKQLGIDSELFSKYKLHIHAPEGAIPKDGPSAGITMAVSIISSFKQCKVRNRLAMTGEITLRGKVLPVGGIKEKILAAKRAGITDIILSEENIKDVEDIKDIYVKGLTFHYVKTVMDVVKIAITDEKAVDAIDL